MGFLNLFYSLKKLQESDHRWLETWSGLRSGNIQNVLAGLNFGDNRTIGMESSYPCAFSQSLSCC